MPEMNKPRSYLNYFPNEEQLSESMELTGQTSVLYLSILFFYAPNVANFGILRIVQKIAF